MRIVIVGHCQSGGVGVIRDFSTFPFLSSAVAVGAQLFVDHHVVIVRSVTSPCCVVAMRPKNLWPLSVVVQFGKGAVLILFATLWQGGDRKSKL